MRKLRLLSLLMLVADMALGQPADSNAVFTASKGKWPIPVAHGYFLKSGHSETSPNTAVSIRTDRMEPVAALNDGEVVLVNEYDSVYMVVVKYGNYFIGYSNLSVPMVKKGDYIRAGQPVGQTGLSVDQVYSVDLRLSDRYKNIDIRYWFRSYFPQ